MGPEEDVFNETEERLAAEVNAAGKQADNLKGVGIALAGAYLLYRAYMWRRLREETAERTPAADDLWNLSNRIFKNQLTRIAVTLVPALISGYSIGLRQAQQGQITQDWMTKAAEDYAVRLMENLHETSGQALIEGYQAQLNRRVAARAALDRTIDAFGVTPRTMKAVVNVYVAPPLEPTLTAAPQPNRTKDRVDTMVARAIMTRARDIGDTEAHAAKNQAKAIVWLYLQQEGRLPADATKMWVTARDERVCPTCGPLHKVQVGLAEKFTVPGGQEVWSPSLHPNCRCDIVLRGAARPITVGEFLKETEAPELVAKSVWGVVSKAVGTDPYDRDRSGRFASQESRQRRVSYKEPEEFVLPKPEQLATLEEIFTRYGARLSPVAIPEKVSLTSLPVVSLSNPSLKSPALDQPKLKNPALKGVELKGPKLSNVKFPSSASLDTQMPDSQLEENENWKPTEDRSFGLFLHEGAISHDGDRSIMLADTDTYFYHDDSDGSVMQDVLSDYWDEAVFNELPERFSLEEGFIEPDDMEDFYQATAYIPDNTGGKYEVTFEQYVDIWYDTVAGADSHDAYRMELPYLGPDGVRSTREITTMDAARLLHIYEEVEFLMPVVGVTNWKNVEAEEYKSSFTNPGKWRVTGMYRDNTKSFMGRDNPMPYKMVFIEPDDLFGD